MRCAGARWRRSPMGAVRTDSRRRRRVAARTRIRRTCSYGACDVPAPLGTRHAICAPRRCPRPRRVRRLVARRLGGVPGARVPKKSRFSPVSGLSVDCGGILPCVAGPCFKRRMTHLAAAPRPHRFRRRLARRSGGETGARLKLAGAAAQRDSRASPADDRGKSAGNASDGPGAAQRAGSSSRQE